MDGDIGGFAVFFITAGGFAQFRAITDDVKDVILNLESDADIVGNLVEPADVFFRGSGEDGSDDKAAVDQAGCLVAVYILQKSVCDRLGVSGLLAVFCLEVGALASDHTEDTGVAHEKTQSADYGRGLRGCLCGVKSRCGSLIGEVQQGVAGKDCHAFSVDDMCGLAAAAVVVIVHGRKVVVNKRIGVNHLQSCHEGFCQLPAASVDVADAGDQERAQAFAAGHGAVAHGGRYCGSRCLTGGHVVRIGQIAEKSRLTVIHKCFHQCGICLILFQSFSSTFPAFFLHETTCPGYVRYRSFTDLFWSFLSASVCSWSLLDFSGHFRFFLAIVGIFWPFPAFSWSFPAFLVILALFGRIMYLLRP